uniref:CSON013443 protein n=1 Tax=Culicoides sonorensis TaxID=179676 RepID=A0A336MDK5_CULSO
MAIKILIILYFMCMATAIPVPEEKPKSIELLKIPLKGDKELDILTLGDEGTLKERNKRTIGVLRELFPELSKIIEQKIQGIVSVLFRTIGPILLRGGLGGAGGAAGGTTTSSSLDDDFSDEEDDDSSNSASSTGGRKVNVALPTFAPFDDSEEDSEDKTVSSSITLSSDSPSKINLLSSDDSISSESRPTSVSNKNEFNLVR